MVWIKGCEKNGARNVIGRQSNKEKERGMYL